MYEIEPIHEIEDWPDLVIAELLGVINKIQHRQLGREFEHC